MLLDITLKDSARGVERTCRPMSQSMSPDVLIDSVWIATHMHHTNSVGGADTRHAREYRCHDAVTPSSESQDQSFHIQRDLHTQTTQLRHTRTHNCTHAETHSLGPASSTANHTRSNRFRPMILICITSAELLHIYNLGAQARQGLWPWARRDHTHHALVSSGLT